MSKEDREITDLAQIQRIIADSSVCHVAFANEGQSYVVPLNFGYEMDEEGALTLYFRTGREGRKMEMLRSNPRVSFVMDCRRQLITGEKASQWGYAFSSVMGEGILEELEDPAERRKGLQLLMHHYGGGMMNEFEEEFLEKTAVLRLKASALSAHKNS